MIIAVDFDNTLCSSDYPRAGHPNVNVINALLTRQANGAKLILWTCRTGEALDIAVDWCREQGIIFDAVNENLPDECGKFSADSRKVYADEYWDDKAFNVTSMNRRPSRHIKGR